MFCENIGSLYPEKFLDICPNELNVCFYCINWTSHVLGAVQSELIIDLCLCYVLFKEQSSWNSLVKSKSHVSGHTKIDMTQQSNPPFMYLNSFERFAYKLRNFRLQQDRQLLTISRCNCRKQKYQQETTLASVCVLCVLCSIWAVYFGRESASIWFTLIESRRLYERICHLGVFYKSQEAVGIFRSSLLWQKIVSKPLLQD